MKHFVYVQPSSIRYLGSHSLPATPSIAEDSTIELDRGQGDTGPNRLSNSVTILVSQKILNTSHNETKSSANFPQPATLQNPSPYQVSHEKNCAHATPVYKDMKSWLTTSIEQLCSIHKKKQGAKNLNRPLGNRNATPAKMDSRADPSNSQPIPRLQVVQKDGSWFAINAATLGVLQSLERSGQCYKVRAEVIPHKLVPANLFADRPATADTRLPHGSAKVPANGYGPTNGFKFLRAIIVDSLYGNVTHKGTEAPSLKPLPYNRMKGDLTQIEETASKVSEEYCFDSLSDNTDRSSGDSDVVSYSSSGDDEDGGDDDDESWDDDKQQGSSTDESEVYDYALDERKIKEYPCNVCNFRFRSQRDLLRHRKDYKHFLCQICDTFLPTLSQYQAHKTVLNHWSDDDNQDVFETVCEQYERTREPSFFKERRNRSKRSETLI